MYEYFLPCLIIAFAGFTQGFSGFGFVLVALPWLTLLLPIRTVVPLLNVLMCCINLILTVQLRRHLQWSEVTPLLLASLAGIPLGVYFLKTVAPWKLELLLGAVLVGFPFYYRYTDLGALRLHPGWAYLAGFCSGCLGGSLGTYAPPIVVYVALKPWDKDEIKAVLVSLFFHRYSGHLRTASLRRPGHGQSGHDGCLVPPFPGFGSILRFFLLRENGF